MILIAGHQKDGIFVAIWEQPCCGELATIIDEIHIPDCQNGSEELAH